MFDNTNDYTLRTEDAEEGTRYYVRFQNGQQETIEEEISEELAKVLFVDFVRIERNLTRFDERYVERLALSEEELGKRIANVPVSTEDQVHKSIQNETLHNAMVGLSEIQRRRVLLYYVHDLTLDEIALVEGCQKTRVKKSIDRAKEKIKKYF